MYEVTCDLDITNELFKLVTVCWCLRFGITIITLMRCSAPSPLKALLKYLLSAALSRHAWYVWPMASRLNRHTGHARNMLVDELWKEC